MRRETAVGRVGVIALESASQCTLAESLVFGERGDGGKGLTAVFALDLRAAVGVHALVAAEIGKLRVRLHANLLRWKEGGRGRGRSGEEEVLKVMPELRDVVKQFLRGHRQFTN